MFFNNIIKTTFIILYDNDYQTRHKKIMNATFLQEYSMDDYKTLDIQLVEVDTDTEHWYEILYCSRNTNYYCDMCNTIIPRNCKCKDYDYTYNFYGSNCFVVCKNKKYIEQIFQIMTEHANELKDLNRSEIVQWYNTQTSLPIYQCEIDAEWL